MERRWGKVFGLGILTLSFVVACWAGAFAQKKPLRVAALLPGAITDNAFNAAGYKALQYLKEKYKVEYIYQENVPQADFEGAFRDLGKKGFDLIWGHGFQFGDAAKKVAPQFPNSKFVVTETTVFQPPNMASLRSRWEELGFMAGAFAGQMTKSGTVGVVGAIPIPVITQFMESFVNGAKYVNPKAKGLKAYNGSLFDVASGKQAALAMIDQGADILAGIGNENILGVIYGARERKVYAIGTAHDQWQVAPDTVMVSAVIEFGVGIGKLIEQVEKGKFEARNYEMTLAPGGGLALSPFHNFDGKVPDKVRAKLDQIRKDIVAGKIKPLPAEGKK